MIRIILAILDKNNLGTFDASIEGIFVEYSSNRKAHKLHNKNTKIIKKGLMLSQIKMVMVESVYIVL